MDEGVHWFEPILLELKWMSILGHNLSGIPINTIASGLPWGAG
jgi:hypothetical protein